jgi:hypothetical protein
MQVHCKQVPPQEELAAAPSRAALGVVSSGRQQQRQQQNACSACFLQCKVQQQHLEQLPATDVVCAGVGLVVAAVNA